MSKITSKLFLKTKCMLIAFYILSSLFVSENLFPIKPWTRNNVTVFYDQIENTISIKFLFIDYEFGLMGEHAYFRWCHFTYCVDNNDYQRLFGFEVKDQIKSNLSCVIMKEKQSNLKIKFMGCYQPEESTDWSEYTKVSVIVKNISNKGYITTKWYVPTGTKVKYILLSGKWFVSGLNCEEDIYARKYELNEAFISKVGVTPDLKSCDNINNIAVSVRSDADAIVIKGAKLGENIQVYSITGALLYSIVANEDVVKIKPHKNQVYFINVGVANYKIAF